MKKVNRWITSLLLSVLFLGCGKLVFAAATIGDFSVAPSAIQMGTQYDGSTLKVTGQVPAGCDVVLRFTGAPEELHLREKGKVFGLLWMNVGKVSLKNVPKVSISASSAAFDTLGDGAAPYRLDHVLDKVEIEKGGGVNGIDVRKELKLLKKSGGLYREFEGAVTLGADQNGSHTFTAALTVPSSLKPGGYVVEAAAVKGGVVVAQSSSQVVAQLTGFPAWLSHLAFGRSLLYGIMATVIAIVSGLVIGLIFQGKGGAH